MGLTTFCEYYLEEYCIPDSIDKYTDTELSKQVYDAVKLWYWKHIFNIAAQKVAHENKLALKVADWL